MRSLRSATLAAALAFVPLPAAASEPRVEVDLARAQLVATGEVVSARALPRAQGQRLLFTELEVRVRECVKGACPASVRMRVPGGRFGEFEQVVEDHPVPVPGEVVGLTATVSPDRPVADAVAPASGAAIPPVTAAPRLWRLETTGEFVAFARALSDAGLSAHLAGVSQPTSRSRPTRSPAR